MSENFNKGFYDDQETLNSENKILKEEKVFDTNYLPKKLRYREKELEFMGNYFSPLRKGDNPKDLSIYGRTGTGKTAVIKFSIKQLSEALPQDDVDISYVNCKDHNTATRVFSKVAREISEKEIPTVGYGASAYFEEIEEHMNKNNSVLVVILDEIDYLGRESNSSDLSDVLYSLTDKNDITTIMISNDATWKDQIEDTRITSRMGARQRTFSSYNEDQLFDILKDRAREGLKEGTWNEEVLREIAQISSNEYGDARMSIKLLYESARAAENIELEEINIDQVYEGVKTLEKTKILDFVTTLPAQQKVILTALSKKHGESSQVTTSKLYDKYQEIVEGSEKFRTIGKNMLYHHLNDLEVYGIIEKQKRASNQGKGSKEMIIQPNFDPDRFLRRLNNENI